MNEPVISPIGQAMGRLPTGLYIVSICQSDSDPSPPAESQSHLGLVASLLTQVGLNPATVCVAIGKGRDHYSAMMNRGTFGVSILSPENLSIMGAFFRPSEDGASPFDDLQTLETPSGHLVIADALAWLEAKVTGSHELEDHHVVFGEVTAGEQLRDGDPAIHLRKDGLKY